MAKLTNVYRADNTELNNVMDIGRRQLPVVAGDNLMMLMDLNSKGLCIDSPYIRGKELEEFTRKYNLLTSDELRRALEIDGTTFVSILNQCVSCVGCRRRVERLFQQLTISGDPTLDPLVLKKPCTLTVKDEKMKTPQLLGTILYRHHDVLNNLLDNKFRNKTRCVLHSLDAFRTKPFSETWREVWSSMKHNCRDELAVIETKELYDVLENYLKKHKFCQGCRTKIEKAYKILVGDSNSKEKGFVATLYSNIKKCHPDKHIHVSTNKIDFLDALIRRAEPEVNGSYSKQRERHAKTLEIAQEEVLTCIGMIMYERLRRVYVSLREEERACQVLAAVGVHALCRSFDTCVEKKQGISNLELLYHEISRAEKAKELKREQKKLKKKLKKNEKKASYRICEVADAESDTAEADEDQETDDFVLYDVKNTSEEELDTIIAEFCSRIEINEKDDTIEMIIPGSKTDQKQKLNKKQKQKTAKKVTSSPIQKQKKRSSRCNVDVTSASPNAAALSVESEKCDECFEPARNCPCDVKDSGYGSEPNSHANSPTPSVVSSPEGSEVSCSDGFCNHGSNSGMIETEDEHLEQHVQIDCCDTSQQFNAFSLQQMLDDCDFPDDEIDNCYIPADVVRKYECQQEKVQQQRKILRETLKQNFERLCLKQQQQDS